MQVAKSNDSCYFYSVSLGKILVPRLTNLSFISSVLIDLKIIFFDFFFEMGIPKTLINIIFFSFFSIIGYSQGEFNNWYFGQHAGITFNSGFPVSLTSPFDMNPGGLSVSISDSLGNYLFYSDGLGVYNKNLTLMPNAGWSFGASRHNQSVIAFPMTGESGKYYLFTAQVGGMYLPNPGLRYSILDMSLDGGLGDIIPGMKDIPVPLGDSVNNQITAIRHHNNRDVWVVARRIGNPCNYLCYLVTLAGIGQPMVSNSDLQTSFSFHDGHLRISPDGSRLVCSSEQTEYCSFDDETGVVTPLFVFTLNPNIDTRAHGAEFSIDSKKLYLSETYFELVNPHLIYQFDATKTDSLQFIQSKTVVGFQAGYSMQIGPDGKIYIDHYTFSDSLAVINNPSSPGISCNFQTGAVSLNGNANGGSLSTFLQKYNLYIHHLDQCRGDTVYFTTTIWPHADSIQWNFGDPASGAANMSTLAAPAHLYAVAGTYTVTLYVRHNDNRTDTTWKTVNVYAAPVVDLGADRIICNGDSATFDAGECQGCVFTWSELTMGQVVGNSQSFTTGLAGVYTVEVTNGHGCTGRDTVQLSLTMPPQVTTTPLTKTICSGEPTEIALSATIPGTFYYWTASLTSGSVTGFSADSGLVISQTLQNIGTSTGVVTYHIIPRIGVCSGDTADFEVTVSAGNPVSVSVTVSPNPVCDGTQATFTATPVNGGSNPIFQWKVNSVNTGGNSPQFMYFPIDGDIVTCVLQSSNTVCTTNNPATSSPVTMTVNPNLPVGITIAPSSNPFCQGNPVTFTATPSNGGSSPEYQWKINGVNAINANNAVYSYIPMNGDVVTCEVTSSEPCPTGNPATSAPVIMILSTGLPAGVSIAASANPFCEGATVTYLATPLNGGSAPSYQWKVNAINVLNATNAVFSYTPDVGDQVSCVVTSNLNCVTANPATSNIITMVAAIKPSVTFTPCNDLITTVNAKPFQLKGGTPIGGVYSGPGVTSATGMFNPASAGTGIKTIQYS